MRIPILIFNILLFSTHFLWAFDFEIDCVNLKEKREDVDSQLRSLKINPNKFSGDQFVQLRDLYKKLDLVTTCEEMTFMNESYFYLLSDISELTLKSSSLSHWASDQLKAMNKDFAEWDSARLSLINRDRIAGNIYQKEQKNRYYGLYGFVSKYSQFYQKLYPPQYKLPGISLAGIPSKIWSGSEIFFGVMRLTCSLFFDDSSNTENMPVAKNINFIGKALTQYYNINIEKEGVENNLKPYVQVRPINNHCETINLILPTHKSSVGDVLYLAQMEIPDYHLFANPSAFAPSLFTLPDKLTQAKGFISVGNFRENYPDDEQTFLKINEIANNLLQKYDWPQFKSDVYYHISNLRLGMVQKHFQSGKSFSITKLNSVLENIDRLEKSDEFLDYKRDVSFIDIWNNLKDGFERLKGKRSTDKLLEELEKGYSCNIVNYPSGFVVYRQETLAPSPQFSKVLVEQLIDKGYKVRIIPVTYDEPSDIFIAPKDIKNRLVVHEPIHPDTVQFLVELEKMNSENRPELLALLLRHIWWSDTLFNKQLDLEEMRNHLKRLRPTYIK